MRLVAEGVGWWVGARPDPRPLGQGADVATRGVEVHGTSDTTKPVANTSLGQGADVATPRAKQFAVTRDRTRDL